LCVVSHDMLQQGPLPYFLRQSKGSAFMENGTVT